MDSEHESDKPKTRDSSVSKHVSNSGECIKVLVRVRPLAPYDPNDPTTQSAVDVTSNDSLVIYDEDKRNFQCSFDAVLNPLSSQQDVYETVRGCTACVLDGFNSTIFAYGQTGSGKTHSMYGPPMSDAARYNDPNLIGLIPRAISEIFQLIEVSRQAAAQQQSQPQPEDVLNDSPPRLVSCQVYCSFVQIYNENLFDMLRDSSMTVPLTIREEKKEIYVQGLSEYNIKDVDESMGLLRVAEENRAIRETYMNQFSSRSHSIFQVRVVVVL